MLFCLKKSIDRWIIRIERHVFDGVTICIFFALYLSAFRSFSIKGFRVFSVFLFFWNPKFLKFLSDISDISPGPFIGPVEIRGKKNKKKIFLFSLLSTGRLNLVPNGWISFRLGYQQIHIPETIEGDIRSLRNQSQTKEDGISVRVVVFNSF